PGPPGRLSPPPAALRPAAGGRLRPGRTVRRLPLLSAGKYRPHLHPGPNVSVIISVAPFFTALLTRLLSPGEVRLRPIFFAGFALAMAGICLLSFSGGALALDPLGDLLALLAALVWACYSVLSRRLAGYGY